MVPDKQLFKTKQITIYVCHRARHSNYKKKMKTKILFLSLAFIVTLASCNKTEITKSHSKEEIENAKRNAKEISKGHDSLLLEMIK
jgi:hypothetical protein